MEKHLDDWSEIAALIDRDKAAALAEFHAHGFLPTSFRAVPKPVRRLWLPAVAASLIVVAALASFWMLMWSWQSTPAGSLSAAGLLDGTFLYAESERPIAEDAAPAAFRPASPIFAAWVEAGLAHAAAAEEQVDPQVPIDRGDSMEVRRKLSRVIRANALERLLTQFREIHDKEV